MGHIKSFITGHEKVLNAATCTYRCYVKEIDRLKEKTQFDEIFSIHVGAFEYDIPYKTLRGHICRPRGKHKVQAETQTFTL